MLSERDDAENRSRILDRLNDRRVHVGQFEERAVRCDVRLHQSALPSELRGRVRCQQDERAGACDLFQCRIHVSPPFEYDP
jgi:hypothetical protein